MSVLLVEDDPSIAIVITAALEAEGFAVTCCDSVAERDRLLSERRYDALVTDVMLTDGDGIESLPAVRALHPDMPVIILSAQNTLDTAVRASDTGAFEYFPKPFDIDELARTVRQAVGAGSNGGTASSADDASDGLPLVGRSAPDLELTDGTRLADHLHEGRALLIDLADDPALRAVARGYEDRLIVVSGKASDTHLRALLVRPDGVVVHASESASGDVEKHLALWLGEPAR